MFQLKLAVPLAAVMGVMLTGSALAACDGERGNYGANRDVERADALIACLDGEVAKVNLVDSPVFGTPLPGNPTFHEIERRLNQFKRQFNIPDATWSQLMAGSAPIDDLMIQDPGASQVIDPRQFTLDAGAIDQMTLNNMAVGQ
jgi:hypothetical protein